MSFRYGVVVVGDLGSVENWWGEIMLGCRIVNGKNKNIKNSLGAMWNASHLA